MEKSGFYLCQDYCENFYEKDCNMYCSGQFSQGGLGEKLPVL